MASPVFYESLMPSFEQSRPQEVCIVGLSQDKACNSPGVVGLGGQKPGLQLMPLRRDLPENFGEGPSCFPASVYPHSLPLNIEDLDTETSGL